MVNRRAVLMCVLFASVLMSDSGIALQTQPPGPIALTLPAFGSARSPVVHVRAGETIAIRPSRLGELIPAIFVYDDTAGAGREERRSARWRRVRVDVAE